MNDLSASNDMINRLDQVIKSNRFLKGEIPSKSDVGLDEEIKASPSQNGEYLSSKYNFVYLQNSPRRME